MHLVNLKAALNNCDARKKRGPEDSIVKSNSWNGLALSGDILELSYA